MSKLNIHCPYRNTTKTELNNVHISSDLLSIMKARVALYLWHHNCWSKRWIHQPSEQHLGVLKIVVILNAILQIFYVAFTVYCSQIISGKLKIGVKGQFLLHIELSIRFVAVWIMIKDADDTGMK